ncbi:MAG: hypothetical protein LBI72_15170 [Flavobacteriaceae bacterium]|jgi:hypothetical protein|nr:hypothetical protein [Flavobacteriaceae bacterium]
MNKIYIAFSFLLATIGIQAQTMTFAEKVGKLMELATDTDVNVEQMKNIIQTMSIDGKEVKISPMSYSLYDDFDGEKMYYIPFKTGTESRFTIEQVTRDGKPFFGMQFLLNSEYSMDNKGVVKYTDPNYAYQTTLEDLKPYCTSTMKYKNGKGNEEESPLLSCIYTNPKSGRQLMYWVVCEKPIVNPTGNKVIEIKIQSMEFWRKKK